MHDWEEIHAKQFVELELDRLLFFHGGEELTQVVFFLVLTVVPEFAQIVQPALLALFFDFSVDVDHVDFVSGLVAWLLCCVCCFAETEEVEELVCVHCAETCILLIDHRGGDIYLESLQAEGGYVSKNVV